MQQMTSHEVDLKMEQIPTILFLKNYQVVIKRDPEILKTSWGPAPL